MPGTLFMVATPIGNLADITLRALETLKRVALIACEDTRVTHKLLAHYEITKPLAVLNEHASDKAIGRVLDALADGNDIAFVSDAGTPGVADPGGKLVSAAHARFGDALKIVPIPGASALTSILAIAGVPTDQCTFLGFLPHKKGRETLFNEIAERDSVTIFYESPHRIRKTLEALTEHCPERFVVIGRELTKIHEEIIRGTVSEVRGKLTSEHERGEFVVLVAGKKFKHRIENHE